MDKPFITPNPPAVLYLASASPRRRELLAQIGVAHQILLAPPPPGDDEPQSPNESAAEYVLRTAREKALRGQLWMHAQGLPSLPVLAADTTVILNGKVLGKPADRAEAIRMLSALAGTRHEVRTAVVLWTAGQLHEEVSVTEVHMRAASRDEPERYCDTDEPYGKAGAYGIQGLAAVFIEGITGSYTGVVGLPLFETARLLRLAKILLP
jgi:septum formation protein